jgi:tetratricopeptide (TPR) repeat protein
LPLILPGSRGTMWNPFSKNNLPARTAEPNATPPANRVEDLANQLMRKGRTKELEGQLRALDFPALSRPEQESWWHLFGIVAFSEGRDAEAFERFKEAHARYPKSAPIRFSLGQQYLRARDVNRAFELFRACRFPDISREFALTQARYAYLWDRYDDGFQFLRPFYDAYRELKILDDHFLYVRGLPFFGQWWSYFAALSILSGVTTELDRVTQFAIKNFHGFDLHALHIELRAYRQDLPELMVPLMEKRLAETAGGGAPTGYTRMNLAVAKSRMAHTIGAAEGIVDAVQLTEQDFPWLEDIRTLAKAEAARRFHRSDLEAARISAFRARQPLLFEPDIALNFHLLRYQEYVKPLYRKDAG